MTEEMQFWKPFSYKSQSFIYGGVYPVILYQKFANFWSKLKQFHGAPLFLGAFYMVLQFGGTKPRQNGYLSQEIILRDDFLGVELVFPFPAEESALLGKLITC